MTDAKPDAVAIYEKLGFIHLDGVRKGRPHGQATPMFLDINTIRAARST